MTVTRPRTLNKGCAIISLSALIVDLSFKRGLLRLLLFTSHKLNRLIGYFRINCPSLYRLMVSDICARFSRLNKWLLSNTMRRCWRLGPDLGKGCLFYVSYESGSLIASKTAITCTIASVISQLPHRQAGRQARWIRYHLKAGDHAGEEQVPPTGRGTRRGAGTTYRQGTRRGSGTAQAGDRRGGAGIA